MSIVFVIWLYVKNRVAQDPLESVLGLSSLVYHSILVVDEDKKVTEQISILWFRGHMASFSLGQSDDDLQAHSSSIHVIKRTIKDHSCITSSK